MIHHQEAISIIIIIFLLHHQQGRKGHVIVDGKEIEFRQTGLHVRRRGLVVVNGSIIGGGKVRGIDVVEEPLYCLAIGAVTEFASELEDTGGGEGGDSDSQASPVNFGVAVSVGLFGGELEVSWSWGWWGGIDRVLRR